MQKFLEALIIFISSLIPSIVTLLLLRRAEEKARAAVPSPPGVCVAL